MTRMIILLTALLLAGCEKSDSVSSSPPVTAQTGKVVIVAQYHGASWAADSYFEKSVA